MRLPSTAKQARARLSDRIRLARRTAKLSQGRLAALLGVTAGAVAQWEMPAGTTPSVFRLGEIANATGVSFVWLGTGKGDARRSKGLDDATPALTRSAFAQSIEEEELLESFRRLPPKVRELINELIGTLTRRQH